MLFGIAAELAGLQSNISRHLAAVGKSADRFERVNQCQTGQQADARMRANASDLFVERGEFGKFPFDALDVVRELINQGQPFIALFGFDLCQRQCIELGAPCFG